MMKILKFWKISALGSLCVLLLGMGACKNEKEEWKLEVENPYNFSIDIGSNMFVGRIIDANGTDNFSGDVNEDGVSLSATEEGDFDDGSATQLGEGMVVFYPEAGKSYKWKAGSANVREIGADGGVGACDPEGYDGPEFDVQVDSQCKMAYMYDCVGDEDGVTVTCALYADWQKDNPNIPDCPYCK